MYPQLINQASRLAPMLQRLMQRGAGNAFSIPGKFMQVDVPSPDGPAQPVNPLDPLFGPGAPSVPISDTQAPKPAPAPAAPAYPQGEDPMSAAPYVASLPTPADAQTPPQAVPMPQARPADAPQPAPDTSFFMRNALMQQDPMGGGLIDPTGAASVRGPDLISKMMGYLNRKV